MCRAPVCGRALRGCGSTTQQAGTVDVSDNAGGGKHACIMRAPGQGEGGIMRAPGQGEGGINDHALAAAYSLQYDAVKTLEVANTRASCALPGGGGGIGGRSWHQ